MNRLLGTLFALATLAAIAYAILNAGNYTSMCSAPVAAEVEIVEDELSIEPDTLQLSIASDVVSSQEEVVASDTELLDIPSEE